MMLSSLLPLHSFEYPALLFSGQASPWAKALEECEDPRLVPLLERAERRIAPFIRQRAIAVPGADARLKDLITNPDAPSVLEIDSMPAVSVPGIVMKQIAVMWQLQNAGLDLSKTSFIGHSQGSLGVAAAKVIDNDEQLVDVLAFALLLGTAATLGAQHLGAQPGRPWMLSVKDVPRGVVTQAAEQVAGVELALCNGHTKFVLSGAPEGLAKAERLIEKAADEHNAAIDDKRTGGTRVEPQFHYLEVSAPFHHSAMQDAADQAASWAKELDLQVDAQRLADDILVNHHDWPKELANLLSSTRVSHLLVTEAGHGLQRITTPLLEGTGITMVPAGTVDDRDLLATPGAEIQEEETWERFAPTLVELPDGSIKVVTAFSRLTGYSPILLAGMTPTTVDPDIVAAAANAGFWAELAGGGQYSEEVFAKNRDGLVAQLNPGRAAQFNSMFFDRYMWNLQFGVQRIVSRSRAAGTAINGVTISAGIPELEEANELIAQLHEDGFPYISFKPGTVAQIRSVLTIARENPETTIIMQVEDGHAGGHHSWVNLEDLLLATYAEIRREPNVVVCVGGGIGTPEKAAEYITGSWSSKYHVPAMPVDGILVGTAAMTTKEAKTSPQVKQLLKDTPGISDGWVGRGESKGGVTSGLSHLHADMYEVDNASAACSRLISSIEPSDEAMAARKDEIIAALNKTAKPYFGEVQDMTYAEWVERFVELAYPWTDPTWPDRFFDLLHRIEARLAPEDHGQIETLFATIDDAQDGPAAVEKLLEAYPQARELKVGARDAAWFIGLNRKHHKPMPWVPAIDADLARWWGLDTLWQSQDERYPADAVRVIPGPVSVAGIDRIDEPVAELLTRFEEACADALDHTPVKVFARLGEVKSGEALLRTAPHIVWHGHLIDNPAFAMSPDAAEIIKPEEGSDVWTIRIHADSVWDELEGEKPYVVTQVDIPVTLNAETATGASPVVDHDALPDAVYGLLAAVAGVGSTSAAGDEISALPEVEPKDGTAFGVERDSFTFPADLLTQHTAVTGAGIPAGDTPLNKGTADALVGPCWPAIYAALGSAYLPDGYPVIEGLLNAVHLDHCVELLVPLEELADGRTIEVEAEAAPLEESASGRIVTVNLTLTCEDKVVARMVERFAVRGRVTSAQPPSAAPNWGGKDVEIVDTPRHFLRQAVVTAPADMTPFAMVSGDYNPIHTSTNAAQLVGLQAPLVHGMWLSATAQHLASAGARLVSWTYSMYGMVQLLDAVEITVERIGRSAHGALSAVEVTCRIDGNVVSRGQAILAPPTTAYIYPGQGIQSPGMAAGDRAASAAARRVWERADAHTKANLGFSIVQVVDENPTELRVGETVFRHPKGVLYLTQFTQVALAVVAYGQTERLRETGTIVPGSLYAGHSLGEYTALASLANIFDLEAVIDIVFSRGSAMHSLVERDSAGRSNYHLGALRPNMFGLDDSQVVDYVAGVAEESGEFLEIVNFNVAGQQYAVAGTVAGLKALAADAHARGGERAYVQIPGIDVPFHSRVLRPGVPAFAAKLDELLPQELDIPALLGRYVPNLVARPFALTQEFAEAICDVVPSEPLRELLDSGEFEKQDDSALARLLMIELLSWQFASPVRWIETQDLLINEAKVEHIVEVGLASAPTLANLAERTLALPENAGAKVRVLNVERDADAVNLADPKSAPAPEVEEEEAPAETAAPTPEPAAAAPEPAVAPTPAPATSTGGAQAGELPFTASDAIMFLFAVQNKVRLDQITGTDTTETLTNGVSSRRNQLLMDMSAELGVPTIDGAAEADVNTLKSRVATAAPGYQAFGPVLTEVVRGKLRTLTGAASQKPSYVGERVTGPWGLPQSWVAHVEAELVLGTREGESVRGGDAGTLPSDNPSSRAALDALIDAAITNIANQHGVSVSLGGGGEASGGGVVDSAALDAYADTVTGPDGVLAGMARTILNQLGLEAPAPEATGGVDTALVEAVEAELGPQWLKLVTPSFDEQRAVLFDDRWASAREDLARLANGAEIPVERFVGTGDVVAQQAAWWAAHSDHGDVLEQVAELATQHADEPWADDIALVTGAAPGSIASAIVEKLLSGGATVIMTASRVDDARKEYARKLYAENASPNAKLWIIPANMSSYRDIDALIQWIGAEQKVTVGKDVQITKPALVPTLVFPFAAPRVSGSLADAGPNAENQARLLLWSVERTIAGVAELAARGRGSRAHILLPGSPNRGVFGGDGAYGEVKAAFDAILAKWHAEQGWPSSVTLAQARIGWVAGTNLMGGNDPLVPLVRKHGIHVYTPDEISTELLGLCTPEAREQASESPIDADFTGGLADAKVSLPELAASLDRTSESVVEEEQSATIAALPSLDVPVQAGGIELGDVTTPLEDMVVIVGLGEVSSWGSRRTRTLAEYGIKRDGDVDLTAAGVLELAWMTGLVQWNDDPTPGWYDASGAAVAEEDIYDRFRDEVVARAGIRRFVDDYTLVNEGSIDVATVYLDRDITFVVPTEAEAQDYLDADPATTSINPTEDGEWEVHKKRGATARVPRRAALSRVVGGQMPTDFDPAKWGIPGTMIEGLDRIAVWNLVTAVDAFLSAGFSPAELLRAVHPADVSSTQGTGIGGMESLHKVFVTRFLGEERPSDILQEALPNVVAAHVMQSLVGGYGQMIHPVAACATAAVSLEEGVDKIRLGKADFVVTGGIDDISVESLTGFGDMNATAESAALAAKGINERFYSRANDRRRGGFVEAEGGGTVLIARGDVAARLGLPVYGVVAHAQSYADGMHTSIPAPGLGALAAGRGGTNSVLARSLAGLGLTPNDVRVLSKHDTSTNANDPNESELHTRLWRALGRDAANPLFVISQKSLTGHAKGGAALFQIAGLCHVMSSGDLPQNAALDCVDPLIQPLAEPLVWLRAPLSLGAGNVKAGVLTSLGFGHVAAVVVLAHPGVFEAALEAAGYDVDEWRKQANTRLAAGARRLEAGMVGQVDLFTVIDGRRFPAVGPHEAEIALLLDPDARLGEDGVYPAAK
ncbi:MAG: DUF1729 domain-containing protein [Corynebacterium sp.]|nr:DUF1729 domain-containing protein [Corynebacterium sp.]